MRHYIVAGQYACQQLMKLKYFKLDLGIKSFKQEKGKDPKFGFSNDFLKEYYDVNRRLPNLNGKIGSIELYIDYGKNPKEMYFWLEGKTSTFIFEENLLTQFGTMEKYLGELLLQVEGTQKMELEKVQEKRVGTEYDNVFSNPGKVSWDEFVAYKRRNLKK